MNNPKTRTMRKFKCKGLKETKVTMWSHNFEEGKVYEETEMPKGYATDGMLHINGLFVDADQFEEVVEGGQEGGQAVTPKPKKKATRKKKAE